MVRHIVIDARNRRSSTGRYTDRLVEHLQDIDQLNRYTILVQPDDGWQMRATNFTTLPCPFPQFSYSPLHQIQFAWQLYQLRADLVHFTMTQQPLLYFGTTVTTTHDLTMFSFVRRGDTPRPVFWLKMRLYHFLMWWSHRKSTRIIVPTHTVASELANFQPFTAKKTVVTYEAVGTPSHLAARQPKGIEGDFIMYLGTAFPHKNLERLVSAFDILSAEHPKLQLILVGKKEKHYEELAQKVAHHPSAKHIRITGFLPDEEAKWLYQHCKAYVFPSLSEGWGLPALEAMANGAVVAASNASCLPEVYGTAARYFNALDAASIAAAVNDVLTDKHLRAELKAAAKDQVAKYSWVTMAEQTLAIYKDSLGEGDQFIPAA